MATYQRPLQPWDPIIPAQQPKPPIRYVRDNFQGTGQDSHTQAPAQDPAMWQALTNVQPITKGVIERRWGYNQFAGPTATTINRLYNFQSDSLGSRNIIGAGLGGVIAFNETGATYNANVFTPEQVNGVIRSITSRNYQYFCDGLNALDNAHRTGDSVKWNGAASGGVTNIGISTADVTPNTVSGGGTSPTLGPNNGSIATDLADNSVAWTNPSNIFSNSFVAPAVATPSESVSVSGPPLSPTITYSNVHLTTDTIRATGFGFSDASNPAGIQVAITYKIVPSNQIYWTFGGAGLTATLVKGGAAAGTSKGVSLTADNAYHTVTLGSVSDLWGLSFTGGDVSASNFGVQFNVGTSWAKTSQPINGGYNLSTTVDVCHVTITITNATSSGTTSTSGSGVGVATAVAGGNITLTLGRIYYLVGNNSNTGHFSDLSVPSGSTGQITNGETDLFLGTYNDPQVDYKYVLATADGGDPSILYEVSVLTPGLVISSWLINGANQVTFTGVYYGGQFTNGQTVTIGGLNHGSYLNGQTLTVTASTPTTFTAAFTHGADSATEIGVAGTSVFAVPNNVPLVVDNTPDPTLVLNQPLLFTDQFGTEYGVSLNDPPPAGNLLVKHQGRLWMAGVTGATHSVYFTKSVAELTLPDGFIAGKYEESWPASNYFDVSDGAENVVGLLSDGVTLYIGTESHIRRLVGNSPANFQQPEIIHPQVGLLNQEVWQIVFTQGSPSGAIWLTPDFRVIQSDFNTYVDIGHPIQDILNGLKPTAQSLAHATFVADGEYDLFILAVPSQQSTYCDLHLIYDMRHQKWFVWQPTAGSTALLYNVTAAGVPQWLFIDSTQTNLFQYLSTAITDNGTTFPVTATTSWLSLAEPSQRKVLNEVEYDGDPSMTLTVNTALVQSDFTSPTVMTNAATSVLGPLGTRKFFLAAQATKARYMQFAFSSVNTAAPIMLGSYNIETIPISDL